MPSAPSQAPSALRAGLLLVLLLLGAALLRAPGITSPPTDIHHVRQSDTASIARNFAREGVDLLHPRIDWAGPDAGTVESELPLYGALTALGWRIVGGHPTAWPRALSTLAWLLGGLGLLTLVRRRLDGPAWAYLALYLLSPLAIAFTRTIQPDALAIALLLWALERADRSGDRAGRGAAAAAGVLVGLAVAGKGTLAFAAPLAVLLAVGRGGPGAFARAALVGIVGAAIPAAWYVHASQTLGAEGASFGIWGAGAHKWAGVAILLDPTTWRALLGTLVVHTLTPVGVVLVIAGGAAARRQSALRPWVVGLALSGACMVAVAEGFRLHNYYQLMLLPFASVLAGAGGLELARRARTAPRGLAFALAVLLLLLSALSGLRGVSFLQDALRRDSRIEIAGLALGYVVPPGRAVVVVDQHPQTLLYAIDRRGWHRSQVDYGAVLEFEDLGAEYLLLTETSPSWSDPGLLSALEDERPLVARSPGWLLFQLQRQRRTAAKVEPPSPDLPAGSGDAVQEGEEP